MEGAFNSIRVILEDRLDEESLSTLMGLGNDACIVVAGKHDHIDRFLCAMGIPFTEISSAEVAVFDFKPSQTVYVNCQLTFPALAAERLRRFVEDGGQLITTDWALTSVIQVAFPGFICHNGVTSGSETVPVHVRAKDDPIVQGFLSQAPGHLPSWSLDASSYPITVLSDQVQKVLVSHKLKASYGEDAVMVSFNYGFGRVYHMISHLYLQHAQSAEACPFAQPGTYAAQHCRTTAAAHRFKDLTRRHESNYAEVQAACCMAEMQVLMLCKHAQQRKHRRNLPAKVVSVTRPSSATTLIQARPVLVQARADPKQCRPQTARASTLGQQADDIPRAKSQSELLHRATATRIGHMRHAAKTLLFGKESPAQFLQKCVHIRRGTALNPQQGEEVLVDLVSQLFHSNDCDDDLLDFHLEENIKPLLLPRFTRIYSLQPACYGDRGGVPYFKPVGWRRFAIDIGNFSEYKAWPIAYHGTKSKNACSILLGSGLRCPSESEVAHGSAGAKRLLGQDTAIYVSPALGVAAHPVYSPLHCTGTDTWAQMVLQCRVKPGSYVVQDNTLAEKHWPKHIPMDLNYPDNHGVEWLLRDGADVIVYGVLIRQFGVGVDKTIYGDLCTKVHPGERGPEYVWTELLARENQQRSLLGK